ncbi:MAG TPA: YihY/virulence factor BrkB family protein [Candidatus Kapabacteria bacterium]|jgi:membrane protein|nr:YihY/virulence factor BrkB family protein [Candidatus Kapabacteria bacterium]
MALKPSPPGAIMRSKKKYTKEGKPLPQIALWALRWWDATKYYAVGLWNYLDDDHCFLLASGIAFNVLLSVIPLSLLLFDIFSLTLQNNENAAKAIVDYVQKSIPIPDYQNLATQWVEQKLATVTHTSRIAAVIGGLTLMWLSSSLFSSLRTTVNAIFGIKPRANLLVLKLLDFLMMFVVMALLLTSTFLTPIVGLFNELGAGILPDSLEPYLNGALPYVISLSISLLLFYLLFRMLPHERLPRKVIFVSSIITVVMIEALKYAFTFYLAKLSNVGALYGTYAFLVGIALWIYFVSVVFTIGAEIGWLYQERRKALRIVTGEEEQISRKAASYGPEIYFESKAA